MYQNTYISYFLLQLEGLAEETSTIPTLNGEIEHIILDDNSTVWSYEPSLQDTQHNRNITRNFASLLSTPSPSVQATAITEAPWAPSRPTRLPLQQHQYAITPIQQEQKKVAAATATVVAGSPKRPRRTSRKPLRFEETVDDAAIVASLGIMEVDPPEEPLASTSANTTTSNTSTHSGRKSRHEMENLTEKQKYHRIRSLNNEASKRCRQKRKIKIKDLDVEEKELMKRNEELKEQHAEIERQRDRMKKMLNMLFKLAQK